MGPERGRRSTSPLPPPPYPPPEALSQTPEPSSPVRSLPEPGPVEGHSATLLYQRLPKEVLVTLQRLAATALREEHERIMQNEICPMISMCCSRVEAAAQQLQNQMQEPVLVEALGTFTLPDGKLTRLLETREQRLFEMIREEFGKQMEPLQKALEDSQHAGQRFKWGPTNSEPSISIQPPRLGPSNTEQLAKWMPTNSGSRVNTPKQRVGTPNRAVSTPNQRVGTPKEGMNIRMELEALKFTHRHRSSQSSPDEIFSPQRSRQDTPNPWMRRLSDGNMAAMHQVTGQPMGTGQKGARRLSLMSVRSINANCWFQKHPWEILSLALILCNCIYLGLEVYISISHQKRGEETPGWLWYGDLLFMCVFAAELAIRVAVLGRSYFTGPDWRWNLVDAFMILGPVVDLGASLLNPGFSRSLHAFRAIRACRIIKVVIVVRELRLMVVSILSSFIALVWALILLLCVLYLFALGIMLTMEAHVTSRGSEILTDAVVELWGSVPTSMLTLFMAISGGADWRDLLRPLWGISSTYTFILIAYVLFVVVGVMNVLTAVFVDTASQIAHIDKAAITTMRDLLHRFSNQRSGGNSITDSALDALLEDQDALAHLRTMGVDVTEVRGLFELLDVDETREVDIDEIIMGMVRLKGTSKSTDVATLMYENKRIIVRLSGLMHLVEDHFSMVENTMGVFNHRAHSIRSQKHPSQVGVDTALGVV